MRFFLNCISYIFHPIFIPLAGTMAYFVLTPKYSPPVVQAGNILPVFILTVIIPIITFIILKNIGVVHTIAMSSAKERKYPFYISIILLLLIVYKVIPNNYVAELHYFFAGLVAGTFSALLLLFVNFKTSIHLVGMGSLLMYLINLSVHFEINITIALSVLIIATGLVASSRLYLKAHKKAEVIIGFFIGVCSQLLTIKFWL